ncbi:MAG TPA: class I tRNA ligase family protein [Thermoplasmata archaeon]|nr:class I tRNA ligase family protein [Thermoplasmata archaeon]
MEGRRPQHWQRIWADAGLATGQRAPNREKFFALVAYPGSSGFFHLGHLRGYAYVDALHRYHRARGRAVLLPFGVHASGLPAVTWAHRVQDRDPATIAQLSERGLTDGEIAGLADPAAAVRFLSDEYRRVLRRMGVLFDEATFVTTIDEDYAAFVRWQMRRLRERGAFAQGSYYASVCPVCGPVAVDPSETDLSSGGDAETLRFVTVPFRLADGRELLAATLRPETVYGVTNLWLAPEEELVVWHRGDHEYVLARPGAERLVEQHGGHVGHTVAAREVLGRTVRVPFVERDVPILESPLVDPAVGTGVVMSVPAHSPADAAALVSLAPSARAGLLPPPVLIAVAGDAAFTASEQRLLEGPGTPAERALRATGATGLSDAAALAEATERLYRLEHARGRMTVAPLAGVPVRDARDRVSRELAALGRSFELQEFSKPVICRNGHAVIIRRVSDQWFLRYSDPGWKAATRASLERLTTVPTEYARELPGILDWFQDRPCARKGPWLGTPLPFDPAWVVEPIADSTFYMAYFVVRRFVSAGRLTPAQLTDAFFDEIFLGLGTGEPTVPAELRAEVRAEFGYWYPLDINLGGKEHKSVHFPVFLFTHAKLLPPELGPRGIFVNGWITGASGTKLSKKGMSGTGTPIPPIDDALERWGPDALRLYYITVAAGPSDVEWDAEDVEAAAGRLADVERLVRESRGDGRGPPDLDAWLSSVLHRIVARVRVSLDAADLRTAAEEAFVALPAALRRYYARGGSAGAMTDRVGRTWIGLLAPFAPHLAEELGDGRFGGLVAVEPFPSADDFAPSPTAEASEALVERTEDDLRAVLRAGGERGSAAPGEVVFFVAAPWKSTVEAWMREDLARGASPSVRSVMERAKGHPELAARLAQIPRYVERVAPGLRSEPAPGASVEELEVLRRAEGYLAHRFGFRAVTIVAEDEGEALDPLGRRDRARPARPAFYLVGRPPRGD